ncbi:MAG TPA: ATP-binding cassette domain-containing protein [Solirubrobacteraceae bacterium]|jgi:ABC-type lipoprotein export system ATPase subunit|nr:ATP-binding cassette domain-containing protein [Solirubrobacteraceae bacterium]
MSQPIVEIGAAREVSEPVVELRDVFCVHRTGDAAAIQGLELDVGLGEQVCVLGPSGAGKTTLLRLIAGLQQPSAGSVRVLGRDVGRLSRRRRAAFREQTIGFLDQHAESALSPDLTVAQSVGLPLALRGVRRTARALRVSELLDAVGLGERVEALPHELSGGERQRVALCAALAHRPAILLADEPTAELDEDAASGVNAMIAELGRAAGTTVIVVSHDPASAKAADRTVWIRGGRVVAERRGGGPAAVVVGRGGLVPIPPATLGAAGIAGRAVVEPVEGGLRIAPGDGGPAQGGWEAAGRVGRAPVGLESDGREPGGRVGWEAARVELRSLTRTPGRGADRRLVLDRVSVVFAPGRLTVVTGRSGAGKTTLLRVIAGLDRPDAGQVVIDGTDVGRLDDEEAAGLRRAGIGYLPQEPGPVGFLSAAENVGLGLRLREVGPDEAGERASVALGRVGLADRETQRVHRLSAGETQRVGLARALACARGLLIVDEPTSRLDGASAELVGRLLVEAARTDSQTVICATHDARVIACADEIVELGRRPAVGAAVRADP